MLNCKITAIHGVQALMLLSRNTMRKFLLIGKLLLHFYHCRIQLRADKAEGDHEVVVVEGGEVEISGIRILRTFKLVIMLLEVAVEDVVEVERNQGESVKFGMIIFAVIVML